MATTRVSRVLRDRVHLHIPVFHMLLVMIVVGHEMATAWDIAGCWTVVSTRMLDYVLLHNDYCFIGQ